MFKVDSYTSSCNDLHFWNRTYCHIPTGPWHCCLRVEKKGSPNVCMADIKVSLNKRGSRFRTTIL